MIAACPKCTARYRVDESRIGKRGAKLKCSRCEALFRVLAPPQPTAASEQAAPQVEVPSPSQSEIDEATLDRDRLVVVADPNVDAGKATVNQLSLWGLTPILVHDGVEAMEAEIAEGRVLFAQRIDEGVRAERDFIVDELLRVAKERGMP